MAVASVVLSAAVIYFLLSRVTEDVRALAEEVALRFEGAMQFRPEIRVDGHVVVEATMPEFEIVTASQEGIARYRWSNTYLYSTKEIEIEAPFIAKAGFVLSDPLRIRIEPRTRLLSADIPKASILSLEMGDPRILKDEDGLWNKLTKEDRETAFRELRKIAENKVHASKLTAKATVEAEARIRELLATPRD
ncbi:MAG: hypothetical protein Fur0032_16010 [Terrimicrobiaceae bacterium]